MSLLIMRIILLLISTNPLVAMISRRSIWFSIFSTAIRNLFELISNMISYEPSVFSVNVAWTLSRQTVCCAVVNGVTRLIWFISFHDIKKMWVRAVLWFLKINAIEKPFEFLWKNRLDFFVRNITFFCN